MENLQNPITRKEKYYGYLTGEINYYPTNPITREEQYLHYLCKNGGIGGGGGSVSPEDIEKAVEDYFEQNPVSAGKLKADGHTVKYVEV